MAELECDASAAEILAASLILSPTVDFANVLQAKLLRYFNPMSMTISIYPIGVRGDVDPAEGAQSWRP